jgi:micrococcal nuclease
MKFFFLLIISITSMNTNAQKLISLNEVKDNIGDSVKLKGQVYAVKYLQQVKGSPTFLDVGGAYPNEALTLVIWNNTRNKFKDPPEELFNNKTVSITGRILLYRGRPEIVISEPGQIEIVE